MYQMPTRIALATSDFRSDKDVLKTETSYLPNNSMKVLLDKPAISAACPADNFPSSHNLNATIIEKS